MRSPPAEFAFARRAVYLAAADALVVADLHLGRAAAANIEFPLGEQRDLLDRLAALLDRFDPAEVVVAGDLLHAFDRVPPAVAEAVASLAATVEDGDAALVVVEGNHDAMLGEAYDGPVVAEHRLADGETVVAHGHEAPDADADRYVVGHDHPAIAIEGQKHPCFLYRSPADGPTVLALPAFDRLARGSVVNGATGADVMSPLLSPLGSFRPVVYDADADEALQFPPLSDLREHL